MGILFRHCGAIALASATAFVAADARAIFIATEPWVRPAASGRSTEAYVQLTSTEGATLVGARCADAGRIELASPGKPLPAIDELSLPAGREVGLAPKGTRFVLRGLKRTLKVGDRVAIVLVIRANDGTRQEIPLDAEVRLRSPTDDHRGPHSH